MIYSDPFWGLLNLAFMLGLWGTIILVGLWESLKWLWSRYQPRLSRSLAQRRDRAELARLRRFATRLDTDALFAPSVDGGAHR